MIIIFAFSGKICWRNIWCVYMKQSRKKWERRIYCFQSVVFFKELLRNSNDQFYFNVNYKGIVRWWERACLINPTKSYWVWCLLCFRYFAWSAKSFKKILMDQFSLQTIILFTVLYCAGGWSPYALISRSIVHLSGRSLSVSGLACFGFRLIRYYYVPYNSSLILFARWYLWLWPRHNEKHFNVYVRNKIKWNDLFICLLLFDLNNTKRLKLLLKTSYYCTYMFVSYHMVIIKRDQIK